MLPLSLRVTWFVLSLTGTINCWGVFISFCRAVGRYWPLQYCFGCTLTHGAFWMGMASGMDSVGMSRHLCLAQLIIINLGVYIMTGITATFVVATTHASYKPKMWKEGQKGILNWSPLYIFFVYLFPVVCSGVQLAIMGRFDHPSRSENLFCDYSNPTWIRFFAYAGTPWLLTIPCLYFSITTLLRIHRTNEHLERSRDPDVDIENLTALPQRPQHVRMTRVSSVSSRPSDRQTSSSTLTASRGLHGHPTMTFNTSTSSISIESGSRNSSFFPTFASMSRIDQVPSRPERASVSSTILTDSRDVWREILGTSNPSTSDDEADQVSGNGVGTKVEAKGTDQVEDDCSSVTPPPARRSTITQNPRKILPVLPSDIYWLIYFQIAFAGIQALCSISSIVDVARGGTPAPFGTQHVALLLWAWAPTIFLVHWRDILKRNSQRLSRPIINQQLTM